MNPSAFVFAALVRATPLLFLGLAVALAFRARVFSIGAEGQLLAGASAAVSVGLMCSGRFSAAPLISMELLAGAAAGAAWSGIAAMLRLRFGVLEVISTLMLNFIAQNAVSFLVRGPLQEPTHVYPQTASLAQAARMPALVAGQRLNFGFVLAIGLAIALSWGLRSTAVGFRIRVVGDGAAAAASAGHVNVNRVILHVFLASGALAGLGGAVEATGVTYALYEGISPGFGYTAIAVALLARLDPLWVIISSIAFGALEAGAAALQRDAGIPAVLVTVIESLIILGLLMARHVRPGRPVHSSVPRIPPTAA